MLHVLDAAFPLVLMLSLCILVAISTHLVMSLGQTLIHYKIAHHPIGGEIFRSHVNFHHTHYSEDHLVSRKYLGDEGNTTPYFLIPILPAVACAYLLLPLDLFAVAVAACAASFYGHVYLDKEYHSERSRLQHFAWFRRKQQLHFVHHRHADCNFAVIHFFWDRALGTYRRPDAEIDANRDIRIDVERAAHGAERG
ncbi:MAG: sterol desaturase family protein [Xanthobacteraceae bacterium]